MLTIYLAFILTDLQLQGLLLYYIYLLVDYKGHITQLGILHKLDKQLALLCFSMIVIEMENLTSFIVTVVRRRKSVSATRF